MWKISIMSGDKKPPTTLEEILKRLGYEVVTCNNPEDALGQIKSEEPHVVLIDIDMLKRIDMRILILCIKQARPFAQAIIIAESANRNNVIEYSILGFSGFLNPRVKHDEIAIILKQACETVVRQAEIMIKKSE